MPLKKFAIFRLNYAGCSPGKFAFWNEFQPSPTNISLLRSFICEQPHFHNNQETLKKSKKSINYSGNKSQQVVTWNFHQIDGGLKGTTKGFLAWKNFFQCPNRLYFKFPYRTDVSIEFHWLTAQLWNSKTYEGVRGRKFTVRLPRPSSPNPEIDVPSNLTIFAAGKKFRTHATLSAIHLLSWNITCQRQV